MRRMKVSTCPPKTFICIIIHLGRPLTHLVWLQYTYIHTHYFPTALPTVRVEPSKAGSGLFALLPQVRVVLTKYNHILTLSFPSPRINLQDQKQLPQSGKMTHKQFCFSNLCLVDSLGNATVLILTYIITFICIKWTELMAACSRPTPDAAISSKPVSTTIGGSNLKPSGVRTVRLIL